jgi:hypothetical protein
MSVFSVNQNRQFYVVERTVSHVVDVTNVGDVTTWISADGVNKELYFFVKGAEGILKSDRIQLKNLSYVKAIAAAKLRTPLKSILVSLNKDVNGGTPVVGQDYILRINFRQFYGMSDEDQYFKDVAVHVTSATSTADKFYKALVKALNLSFARELGATKDSNPYLTFTASSDGVLITEKEQPWHLGTEAQEPVIFEIFPTTIYVDGVDEIWGTQVDKTPKVSEVTVGTNGYGNGKKIADLEWFCMGERGDQYRQIGWPNSIDTKPLVDPTKEYNVLEIHYVFTDEGVSSYRSEKDITIVSTSADVINILVGTINYATGLRIAGTDDVVPTAETSEEKAVVDSTDDAVGVAETEGTKAVVDEAAAVADTTEEKPVVDGTEESTEEKSETTETEGTETITA